MKASRRVDASSNTPKVFTPLGLWHFAYYVARRAHRIADPSWGNQAGAVLTLAIPTMFAYLAVGLFALRVSGWHVPRQGPGTSAHVWVPLAYGLAIVPNALLAMRKREYQEYRRQFDLWPSAKMTKAKLAYFTAVLAVVAAGYYMVGMLRRGELSGG